MNEQQNIATIRTVYEGYAARNIEKILDNCTPDVEFRDSVPRSDTTPQGGTWQGRDGFRNFFIALDIGTDVVSFVPQTYFAQGDQVAVVGEMTLRSKMTGKSVTTEWVQVWQLRDGKVARGRDFTDSAGVLAAYNAAGASNDEQQNIALVRGMYEAFSRGDIPSIVAAVTDDFAWQFPVERSAALPQGGTWQGKDGFVRFFQALREACELPYFAPKTFVAQGDNVIVTGEYIVRSKATGKSATIEWVHAWTLRDGKPARGREFTDTAAIGAIFDAPVAAAR